MAGLVSPWAGASALQSVAGLESALAVASGSAAVSVLELAEELDSVEEWALALAAVVEWVLELAEEGSRSAVGLRLELEQVSPSAPVSRSVVASLSVVAWQWVAASPSVSAVGSDLASVFPLVARRLPGRVCRD